MSATAPRRVLCALLLVALPALSLAGAAMAAGAEPTGAQPPNPAVTGAMAEEMRGALQSGGVISEDEFRAMNQPEPGQVPALHGGPVRVDGQTFYLSLPSGGDPPFPGIVVVHEWWGLNDHIRLWCDRLAALGYAALAVDLYGGRSATDPDSARALASGVQEGDAVDLLRAAETFLRQDPRIRAPRTASIGWCFGGGYSLQLALHAPDLNACVVYYGHLVSDPSQLAAIHGPLLGIFGRQDRVITPAAVAAFDSALTRAGVEHQIFSYDAPHAFANPSGAGYHQRDAADAWNHVQAFLAENLKPAAHPAH